MVLFTTVAILVLGPTMMFNSMRGKHDDQQLLTLPASNLEKYLMRYSYWLLLLPSFVGSFASYSLSYGFTRAMPLAPRSSVRTNTAGS